MTATDGPQLSGSTDRAEAKKALRRRVRSGRRARVESGTYAEDRRHDAAAVVGALLPAILGALGGPAPCAAIYQALPAEPPTDALAAELLRRDIRVLVPVLLPDRDLDWRVLPADGSVGPALGLAAIAAAQVIVVPALSVDRRGHRLGQGGGSYDRSLARRGPGSVVVAILNHEEYDAYPIPADRHDVRVDAVVTTAGEYHRLS